jgi:opacity protein-like surface antigen
VKGLYDFKIGGKFTPYVGAGVTNRIVNGIEYARDGSLNLGVVGVAGVQFALTDKIALDLQYNREFWYRSNAGGDASYNGTNVFKLGGVYKF